METTLNEPNNNRNSMVDAEYWANIEDQIDHAQSQINTHQQQRLFFIEVIFAVIGFGFLLNLLTSLIYDVWILNQQIKYANFFIGGIIIVSGLFYYQLKRIFSRYSPITPRIRFNINPMNDIDNFDTLWSKTKEIISHHDKDEIQRDPSPVIQELWDSIKNSMFERPPYKSYLILKRELYDYYYVDFKFETEYLGVKYQLDILFHRSSMLKNHEPDALVTVTILEPYKPHADNIWDKYAILTLTMDISYVLREGIVNFNKKYEKNSI